jgi:hypothetical protein
MNRLPSSNNAWAVAESPARALVAIIEAPRRRRPQLERRFMGSLPLLEEPLSVGWSSRRDDGRRRSDDDGLR